MNGGRGGGGAGGKSGGAVASALGGAIAGAAGGLGGLLGLDDHPAPAFYFRVIIGILPYSFKEVSGIST